MGTASACKSCHGGGERCRCLVRGRHRTKKKRPGKKPFSFSVRSAGETWADAAGNDSDGRKTAKLGWSLGGDAAAAAHPRFHWNSLSKHVAQLADWREAPDRFNTPNYHTRNRPNCTQLFVGLSPCETKATINLSAWLRPAWLALALALALQALGVPSRSVDCTHTVGATCP